MSSTPPRSNVPFLSAKAVTAPNNDVSFVTNPEAAELLKMIELKGLNDRARLSAAQNDRITSLNGMLYRHLKTNESGAGLRQAASRILNREFIDGNTAALLAENLSQAGHANHAVSLLKPLLATPNAAPYHLSMERALIDILLVMRDTKAVCEYLAPLFGEGGAYAAMPEGLDEKGRGNYMRLISIYNRTARHDAASKVSNQARFAKENTATLLREHKAADAAAHIRAHVTEGGELYRDYQAQAFYARGVRDNAFYHTRSLDGIAELEAHIGKILELGNKEPTTMRFGEGSALDILCEIRGRCNDALAAKNPQLLSAPKAVRGRGAGMPGKDRRAFAAPTL